MVRQVYMRLIPEGWKKNIEGGKCPVCGLHKDDWPKRRQKQWRCCSVKCTQKWIKTVELYWPNIREQALKRDNYTCVKCGDNRKQIEVEVKRKAVKNFHEAIGHPEIKLKFEIRTSKDIRPNLQGDHIIPIALGGDEFDLVNVQTLCIQCHKEKTKKDIADIARKRRVDKICDGPQTTLPKE